MQHIALKVFPIALVIDCRRMTRKLKQSYLVKYVSNYVATRLNRRTQRSVMNQRWYMNICLMKLANLASIP